MTLALVVLEGDQTGQELLEEALRILQPDVIGVQLAFRRYDLSLENRRRTKNRVVYEAAAAVLETGVGIKAATITPEEPGDVGSANAILREQIGAHVILRVGRRLPGVRPVGGVYGEIAVVRMAVGDAYGAKEWREQIEDGDELAFRTDRISRRICRIVAEYAFRYAEQHGAKVFGGPKFTISPVYEGMFKEELDAAAARHPEVKYEPVLIDALYAALLSATGEPLVVPALNRDGDCLSDFVLQLFGSIAGAESRILSFNPDFSVRAVVTEATHGTAPRLFRKNVANPLAMILAAAAALNYMADPQVQHIGDLIREAALDAIRAGVRTADLQGHASTTDVTDAVIARVRTWRAEGR
jgi:isocitrate dehydrogenase (NAD+)